MLGLAAPAVQAQETRRSGQDFEALIDTYVPEADDPNVLAALAYAAASTGERARFIAVLDSVVRAGPGYPNALQYWGALSLQSNVPAGEVRDEFEEYLIARPEDRAALLTFFRVLEGNGEFAAAGQLLDGAEARGAPAVLLFIPRGQLLEVRGEPVGAIGAYLDGITVGGSTSAVASVYAERLLTGWPPDEDLQPALDLIEQRRGEVQGQAAATIAHLAVLVNLVAEEWQAAIDLALDPALSPPEQAAELRAVAGYAAQSDKKMAQQALQALLELGSPPATTADRILLARFARDSGDSEAAVETLRSATGEGIELARTEALVLEVEEARETGDIEALSEALREAVEGGVDRARIAISLGDMWLSRAKRDSALAAYVDGVGKSEAGPMAIESLSRIRLIHSLARVGVPSAAYGAVGRALMISASAPPAAAASFDSLASALAGKADGETARALLRALSAESMGRGGDVSEAVEILDRALTNDPDSPERPVLLLAAGRWAAAAGEVERASQSWRELIEDHSDTPYALEARRLMSQGTGGAAE